MEKPLTYAYWRRVNGYERYNNYAFIKDGIITNCNHLEIKYRAYHKAFKQK